MERFEWGRSFSYLPPALRRLRAVQHPVSPVSGCRCIQRITNRTGSSAFLSPSAKIGRRRRCRVVCIVRLGWVITMQVPTARARRHLITTPTVCFRTISSTAWPSVVISTSARPITWRSPRPPPLGRVRMPSGLIVLRSPALMRFEQRNGKASRPQARKGNSFTNSRWTESGNGSARSE